MNTFAARQSAPHARPAGPSTWDGIGSLADARQEGSRQRLLQSVADAGPETARLQRIQAMTDAHSARVAQRHPDARLAKDLPGGPSPVQLHTTGRRVPSTVEAGKEELEFITNPGEANRDVLKQQVIDDLGQNLQPEIPQSPHVAVSLTARTARIAFNKNSQTKERFKRRIEGGVDLSVAAYNAVCLALRQTYAARIGVLAAAPVYLPIQAWVGRYTGLAPTILPTLAQLQDGAEPNRHAEQFVVSDLLANPPVWKPSQQVAARGYRVVRMGGTLRDCARCHSDHHGNMTPGLARYSKPSVAVNAQTGSAVFEPGYAGADQQLINTHGRIIRSSGFHSGADGAAPRTQGNLWAWQANQELPISTWVYTAPLPNTNGYWGPQNGVTDHLPRDQ